MFNECKAIDTDLNKNYRRAAAVVIATLMISVVAFTAYTANDSDKGNEEFSLAGDEQYFSFDELGITGDELTDFFGSSNLVSFFLNDEGIIDFDLIQITADGKTDIESTSYGYKIYLSSDLCYAIASVGLAALGGVSGIGTVVMKILTLAGIGNTIVSYIDQNYLHLNSGICIEVKLYEHHKVFGISFSLPTTPSIKSIYMQ